MHDGQIVAVKRKFIGIFSIFYISNHLRHIILVHIAQDMFAALEARCAQAGRWHIGRVTDLKAARQTFTSKRTVRAQFDGQLNLLVASGIFPITNGRVLVQAWHIVQDASTVLHQNFRFTFHFTVFPRICSANLNNF